MFVNNLADGRPVWAERMLWVLFPPIGRLEPFKWPTKVANIDELVPWYIGISTPIFSMVIYPIIPLSLTLSTLEVFEMVLYCRSGNSNLDNS